MTGGNKNYNRIFIFSVIAIGIALRFVWAGDMEWKDDEQWMFAHAHEVAQTGTFPQAGMRSGGGIVNPGLSVGVFALIASFTQTPLAMNRVVQCINALAIVCFLVFALTKIKKEERETWLLGIALASVSPLAVLFSRKIWAQDLLPLFSFMIIFFHTHRHKKWGALLWGLTGALIGQIHMSGFFFAAGFIVFTLLHDYYNKIKFRWVYFISGSVLGSITIIPWLSFMLAHPQESKQSLLHIFQFNFFIYWFLDSLGLNIMYSMRKEFWEFIREPVVGGIPIYIIALAHVLLAGVGFVVLKKTWAYVKTIFLSRRLKQELFINISQTRFYFLAILLGLGILMSLSGITIHPHYLICAFPFSYIFLAKVLARKQWLLRGVIVAQLIITLMFLRYVHTHNGVSGGDYGITFIKQQEKK